MINWSQLVKERDAWVAKNFPPYPDEVPGNDSILGCIEELGELAHAHLKAKQGIRGNQQEHDAAARDAIGDFIVYLLGVISAHVDPNKVGLPTTGDRPTDPEHCIFMLAGEISFMGYFGRYPGNDEEDSWLLYINNTIKYCDAYCVTKYWSLEEIVTETWNHVKQRDWTAHREAGAPAQDPAMKDPTIAPEGFGAFGYGDE